MAEHPRQVGVRTAELGDLRAFHWGEINTLVLGVQSISQVLLTSYPSSF